MIINPILEDENEENSSININTQGKSNSIIHDKKSSKRAESPRKAQPVLEREIDDIADLKEKFKTILLKTSLEDAEDSIIYGMVVNLLTDKSEIIQGIIFSNDETLLCFIIPGKAKNEIKFKINLSSISDLTIGKNHGNFNKLIFVPEDFCLTIHYSSNLKRYDLIFKGSNQLELFVTGIISILQRRARERNSYDTDLLSLKRIWKEYDPERRKFLDVENFSKFLKNINFDFKNKSPIQIFKEIDKKNEGKIRFKDFISFYELLVTGEEFKEVFQKYSTSPNKQFLTIKGLVDFMEKEQHETLSPEEGLKLICKYSKKAKKLEAKGLSNLRIIKEKFLKNKSTSLEATESIVAEYENYSFGKANEIHSQKELMDENELKNAFQLSFREFVNMIIDKQNNNIYDRNKFMLHQNMNLPLSDYYCNSSHNTYLTGNQITSESSVEMYSYVLKNGCRFVDLDTFDGREGDKNEPIITHWHFPVGDINFKQVLITIKEHAFKKSEFPVILSLENHCSAGSQERMEKYFIEVLGRENIYIIDQENPPLIYPSPNELKKKFIIKNKRKRIFGNLNEMKNYYRKLFNTLVNENKLQNESQSNSNGSNGNGNSLQRSSFKIQSNGSTITNQMGNSISNSLNNSMGDEEISTTFVDKKANIINRVAAKEAIIEENVSDKSMDSEIEEGNIELRGTVSSSNKCKLINDIESLEFFPSNHFELEILPSNSINNDSSSLVRKKKRKMSEKGNGSDIKFSPITISSAALKKLKQKYIIDDAFYSLINEDYSKKEGIIKKIEEIKINEINSSHRVPTITVDSLANILGMVGVKYHKETFNPTKFLPWECISIAEPDLVKYISTFENKCKMIEYCQKSFLKIYPDGFRTNSSNQNPILCWSIGCQFAALNLQTTNDDFVLLNKMFFKINGGSKCGYVLKPQSLREFNKDTYRKQTLKPCYKIKFKILSGFHLHLCCPPKEKITGMFIEVSLIAPGSGSKDSKEFCNNKLVTNIISNNFLHPVCESNSVIFDIYEPELSFIVVKLYSKKKEHTLAKGIIPATAMSLGYRVLELYDNLCSKFDESYLIVKTNKIFS